MAATEAFTARRPLWHYWTAATVAVLGLGAVSVVAAAVSGTGRALPGFLGTNARLLNDLNLVLQLLMAASLVLGVVLVRRRNYRAHQLIMSAVVVVNLVAIAFVMGTAFVDQVLPAPAPGAEAQRLSAILHGIAGSLAEALGLYLLLRMYELLPGALRVANFKLLMRLTFGLWLLVVAGGVSLYVSTYAGSGTLAAPAAPPPAPAAVGAAAGGASGGYGAPARAPAQAPAAGNSGYGAPPAAPTAAAAGGAYGAPAARTGAQAAPTVPARGAATVATGAGAGAAPAPAAPAPAQPLSVNMTNFAFGPRELTVKAGTAVTFVNGDRATHTATADGGQFDTGNIAAGNSGSITLTQAGTFRFFCKLHGAAGGQGMSGTVTVQP
jgi:plastocyanin/uncharacterized membrane protein YozB (DUF420 family)